MSLQHPRTTLGSVAQFINGFAFKPADWEDSGRKIIRIQNLTDPSKPYNKTRRNVDEKFIVREGDILVSWSATLDVFEWRDDEALLNQHIFKAVPNPKLVDKDYFRIAVRESLREMAKHTHGSTMKHVNRGDFVGAEIPLPPLATQKHIARVLEQADQLRKQTQQMESELKQLAQSLFLDMFGDPDSNPKRWLIKAIGELASVETGSTPSRTNDSYFGGNIPWVKTGEVRDEYIFSAEESITDSAIKETNCKVFPIDTVLVAMYGQGKTRGKVGVLKVPAATNQACAAILPTDSLLPGFIFDFLKLRYLALRGLGRGGNQENLNLTIVKEFPVFVPPVTSQNEYLRKKSQIDKALKANSQNMALLNDNFESLMQRAFNGELTAPERKAA